jgi:hypothetical protein
MTNPPSSGTRCLVSDGDVVVIATYIVESDKTIWLFNGTIMDNVADTFNVQGWMPLPTPVKKVVVYEDKITTPTEKNP